MSVRIHELAKAVNKDNKEVLDILRARGHEVKTVSSTIDNISAEAFIEEFKSADSSADNDSEAAAPEPAAPAAPEPPKVKLPAGAIVKSADDIARERQEREEEERKRQEAELEKRRAARGIQMPQGMAPAGKAPPAPAPGLRPPRPAPIPRPGTRKPPPGVETKTTPVPAAAPSPAPAPEPAPVQSPEPAAPQAGVRIQTQSGPPVPPRSGSAPVPPPRSTAPEIPKKTEAAADEVSAEAGDAEKKVILIKPPIVVRDFALEIGTKPFKLISELMDMGIFAGMNQTIEEDVAHRIAAAHGCTLEIRHRGEEQQSSKKKEEDKDEDDPALLEPRPPVVCVLGHVDHGKTTLLDSIRKANVVSGEAGGITQHIGAYQVEHEDHKITFIDTPGHAAFSKMRERGANVTDIAVLVVAADDGFMPQTDEALKFAQKANVPVVVAINKADAKGANLDRVKQQMQDRNIAPEDWGGETQCEAVSALKGEGIDDLLSAILIQSEILELKANPKCPAKGMVVESQIEQGRGPTATVIIQKGTLKVGNALVCGENYCKVRAMVDENGKPVKSAPPATPVRVLGWSGAPPAGVQFHTVKNEKIAKREVEENVQEARRLSQMSKTSEPADLPTDLDSLLAAIDKQQAKVLRLIVKADVAGSLEAANGVFNDIKSDKVNLEIIESGVGPITKNDVDLASSASAVVVGFNVRQENGVNAVAKHNNVQLILHNIIYELIDQVKEAMAELLDPEYSENKIGAAEVRQVFPLAKGFVAGCMITEGVVRRDAKARLLRKDEVIHEGKIGTLKRFKDDATEVRAGYECGIQLNGFNKYEEGDIIEAFEILETRPSL
ncbi:translation initiation factor IF-2 [Rubellicoccus peritrichatus]|uniref:Translation initiation factor IF-2 n=1 Tax=Rubellicoccus peritrichatus TaxID=3080537 RepID=A0AAQ3L4Y6_9BACT|nr:translation initiation factor IF-2 [Puniceicoccus sp. CR14]WOO39464.1 translation initiation factor IF-2 [Puniceicoccus sp. CR14]